MLGTAGRGGSVGGYCARAVAERRCRPTRPASSDPCARMATPFSEVNPEGRGASSPIWSLADVPRQGRRRRDLFAEKRPRQVDLARPGKKGASQRTGRPSVVRRAGRGVVNGGGQPRWAGPAHGEGGSLCPRGSP